MEVFNKWFCFYNELDRFFKDISDMPYAIVKGDILSFQAYGSTGKRNYSDIDILVSLDDVERFETILHKYGFTSKQKSRQERIAVVANSHQVSPLVGNFEPWGELTVDLNFDVLWGEYEEKRINIKEFLSDTIEVDIYGVKVKTLSPIKAMVQLVLHHYKDMNSIFLLATRNSINYGMFKDVYYLLKNNLDAISADKLYKISEEYGIIPYVYYVLYHTGLIFDDEIIKRYIEIFKSPEGESLLNHYGLCGKEQKTWKCDFKTRLDTDDLYELIRDDLTTNDQTKIAFNKRYFQR